MCSECFGFFLFFFFQPYRRRSLTVNQSLTLSSGWLGSPVNIRDDWIFSAVQFTSVALKMLLKPVCFVFFCESKILFNKIKSVINLWYKGVWDLSFAGFT